MDADTGAPELGHERHTGVRLCGDRLGYGVTRDEAVCHAPQAEDFLLKFSTQIRGNVAPSPTSFSRPTFPITN